MTPVTDYETTRIDIPAKAAAQLLALAQARDVAQMRLEDAGNMARMMANAPEGWELRAENGQVFFAPPKAPEVP